MARAKSDAYPLEVRRVSTVIGETGTEDRTEETYQLGATIDGGFVPFVTKSAGYIDHLAENDRQRQEQDTSDDGATDEG